MTHSGHNWTLHVGDCRDVLRTLPDASVDAVVTDPPYDLTSGKRGGSGAASVNLDSPYGRARIGTGNGGGFMGKAWDATGIAFDADLWAEVLRVLKPGGHLLAFGGTRTSHRMVCAIEDAGFEVRDSIHWVYGSGFPKSLNLSEVRDGWGTALKPAHEPICVARKPLVGTVAANVQAHGTGGINVDGCRVGATKEVPASLRGVSERVYGRFGPAPADSGGQNPNIGRWPANFLLTHAPGCRCVGTARVKAYWGNGQSDQQGTGEGVTSFGGKKPQGPLHADDSGHETVSAWECAPGCPVAMMDAQSGELTSGFMAAGTQREGIGYRGGLGCSVRNDTRGDTGTASRFFPTFAWDPSDFPPFRYVAKASTSEREQGCERLPKRTAAECVDREPDSDGMQSPRAGAGRTSGGRANVHPTVKPVALMAWLCRLVTPQNGLVLDPFAGSGTTGVAALRERFRFVGVELSPEYAQIAVARLSDAARQPDLFAAEG